MPAIDVTAPAPAEPARHPRFWLAVYVVILVFVAALAVETALRIPFPWDLYQWSESPFLTNMLKLDAHQPIYTAPADGNSFVYSPGLEYICYAVLKPFSLELDIRWDRLVSTLLGVFAAGFGALSAVRLARPLFSAARTKVFFFVTWGMVWLVLSKNFMADIDHPDNLQTLHAALVFWLTLAALDTKQFGVALLTMLVAGVGVLTKQTEMFCFLGPLAVFAIYRPWGWGRWLLLGAVGAGTLAVSAGTLWHSADARFWTLELLTQHQRVWPTKSYTMLTDLLWMDRGLLMFLAIIALPCLWSAGGVARRFLVCWMCTGFFSVLPNLSGYLKTMGIWNNLIIMEVWMILIVWPFFGMLVESLPRLKSAPDAERSPGWDQRLLPYMICVLMLLLIALLLPMKVPPRAGDMAFGRALDAGVAADLKAGRKVLLTHTTEPLIHAGVRDVPRDRVNSVLEMVAGDVGSMSDIKSRIGAHYYDRIYLLMGAWYHEDISNCIEQNYQEDFVIPGSPYKARLIYGYGDLMMDGCRVMMPRETNAPARTGR